MIMSRICTRNSKCIFLWKYIQYFLCRRGDWCKFKYDTLVSWHLQWYLTKQWAREMQYFIQSIQQDHWRRGQVSPFNIIQLLICLRSVRCLIYMRSENSLSLVDLFASLISSSRVAKHRVDGEDAIDCFIISMITFNNGNWL